MSYFTLSQVVQFGDERNWKPAAKRAFKEFRARFSLPAILGRDGIQTANAFIAAYDYLVAAAAEERTELAAMPDQADAWHRLKTRAGMKRKEAEAAAFLAAEKKRAEVQATLIEPNRTRRAWRLCGLFLEGRSLDKYTLDELERWADWAAYFRFRKGHFSLAVECVECEERAIVTIDWTERFTDYCCQPSGFDFEKIAQDLRRFTAERRAAAAASN